MNPYQSYGEAEVTIDGTLYRLQNVTIKLPGKINNSVDNGRGFAKQTVGGHVKGTMRLMPGDSVEKLRALDDVTVYAKLDTGHAYTASHAWIDGDPEITNGEGFEVTFAFNQCTEVLNG